MLNANKKSYEAEIFNIYSSIIKNPKKTFIIKVNGNSMIDAGINTGDFLLVDRTLKPENDKIVIASVNNHLIVKKIVYAGDMIFLVSENLNFKPIEISDSDKLDIWGVVIAVIKSFD